MLGRTPERRTALGTALVIALAAILATSGCSTADRLRRVGPVRSAAGGNFVIWIDANRAEALRPFAERFGKARGISVQVVTPPAATTSELTAAVRRGDGPDIVAGPHEWIGELVRDGTIVPVPLSNNQRGRFATASIDAVTYDEQRYGVPFAIENAALIRNLRLAANPPATIEQAIAIGEQLRRAGMVTSAIGYPVGEHGDPYHLYPLYVSAGGTLFGGDSKVEAGKARPDRARLDVEHLGLAEPEAAAAFTKISMLGAKGPGALTPAMTADRALTEFVRGRTPFLVAGPEVLPSIRQAGFEYGVSAVPGFQDGAPTGPLITVSALFVTSGCSDPRTASDLVTSVLTQPSAAVALYTADPRPPALTEGFAKVRRTDSDAQRFFDTGRGGLLLPSIPQMSRLWGPLGQIEAAVLTGADVQTTLQAAITSIVSAR